MKKYFLMSMCAITLLISSCDNFLGTEGDDKNESTFSSNESHNTGKNCMSCHKSGGSGEGNFTIAGTLYDNTGKTTVPGATIKLYSEADAGGNLIKTIQVDKLGNFYTTSAIDFGTGLYPVVVLPNMTQTKMSQSIKYGSCNSCHDGVTLIRIF